MTELSDESDTRAHRDIVAGVDGSESSLRAVHWAALEARRHSVPLRLVHVCHPPPVRHGRVALPSSVVEALADCGKEYLADAEHLVGQVTPEVVVRSEQREGHPAEALIDAAETARLVVLGSRGIGGFTSLLVGSVALTVSARARCPVVVTPATDDHGREDYAHTERGPVAVGVGRGSLSDAALGFGFEEASVRGVDLMAVHIWNEATIETGWPDYPMRLSEDDVIEAEHRALAECLAGWRERYPDVDVDSRVRKGKPAKNLLSEARAAQLIVVGTSGKSALAGLSLGSTSQAVLHHAHCPVAMVRSATG